MLIRLRIEPTTICILRKQRAAFDYMLTLTRKVQSTVKEVFSHPQAYELLMT